MSDRPLCKAECKHPLTTEKHTETLAGIPCLMIHDALHEKIDLKVFVVVTPKEGLVGWGPANSSLGMTPTTEYINL